MNSLHSLIPALAPIFGLTEKSLYERQKALVRMGMLPTPQGRGRGSGAPATPENVALLVIAVMATDRQADDDRVRKLALAPFIDGKKDRCPWTGATVFKDALSLILSPAAPTSKPGRVIHNAVHVSRAEPAASIFFSWPKRGQGWSEFKRSSDRGRDDRLLVSAELPDGAIQEIRLLLSDGGSS
ncbi:hypothetical protein [Bradyrhizobium sp. NP1]|uniref:hypothetical protein n=1 Tax=Bradyrhizobium sp. NP1 TaxID=3049772 RepID=UPI0025A67946|nr:hypothetical protein [Bradyrhizobium sp. NP1]WJR74911.1 hypothetical protein QOU61_18970 [Bradyrhizobium sp. NP1]